VKPISSVVVRSRIDGVLTQVLAHEGQIVRAGDLLAVMDDRALTAALEQARASMRRDQAQLEIEQRNLDRDIHAADTVSRQVTEQQGALVRQLTATVESDSAVTKTAEIQLSYTRLQSPVAGRVGLRHVDAGNVISSDDRLGLFTVVQLQPIAVIFAIPESALADLHGVFGDLSHATVYLIDRRTGNRLQAGALSSFDNQIEPSTGTLQLKGQFANTDNELWPGEAVTVQLLTGVDRDALVVDRRSVQRAEAGDFVFIVRRGAVEAVPVEVRYQNGAAAVVTGSLLPGDDVVTDGQWQLKPGDRVAVATKTSLAAH